MIVAKICLMATSNVCNLFGSNKYWVGQVFDDGTFTVDRGVTSNPRLQHRTTEQFNNAEDAMTRLHRDVDRKLSMKYKKIHT